MELKFITRSEAKRVGMAPHVAGGFVLTNTEWVPGLNRVAPVDMCLMAAPTGFSLRGRQVAADRAAILAALRAEEAKNDEDVHLVRSAIALIEAAQ